MSTVEDQRVRSDSCAGSRVGSPFPLFPVIAEITELSWSSLVSRVPRNPGTKNLICKTSRHYYIPSSSNMPLFERLLASSNKKPRRSSLYLWRAVILSACLASAFSYTQARGRPDRSSLRVQWNVTGKTERERDVQRAIELLVGCHVCMCRRP